MSKTFRGSSDEWIFNGSLILLMTLPLWPLVLARMIGLPSDPSLSSLVMHKRGGFVTKVIACKSSMNTLEI